MNPKVLVVDDETHICEIAQAALEISGFDVDIAGSAEEALESILEKNYTVIVSDIRMPGMNGMDFLKKVKLEQPSIAFLMITAHGSMELLLEALRGGASDFLHKPFDIKELRQIVTKLVEESAHRTEPIVEPVITSTERSSGIIGKAENFTNVLSMARKAASKDVSMLILGESGTGKEVLAKEIHQNSSRVSGAFIAVNCGAIPENLMESELFGFEKGAFTGAIQSKPGKVELAEGGTLFLDEIGEMPLSLQVKLLRVLQERCIERVGGTSVQKVDFRLLAATHCDLESMVAEGRFREDLLYRLNVVTLNLPSLKARLADIVPLAEFFLGRFNERYNTSFVLSNGNQYSLKNYDFPGNIRELENIIERAVVLSDGDELEFALNATPKVEKKEEPKGDLKEMRKIAEKESILDALETCRWNKTKTAEHLGISRRSLLYKVKAYEIE